MAERQIRPTILIVDDEEAVLKTVRMLAEEAGYEVVVANSGKEAISAATAWSPDLLITDIFMPHMDGLELIQHFLKEFPATKLIAMSGTERGIYLATARRLGAHDVLPKPIQRDQLLQAIAQQIGKPTQ